MSVLAAIDHTDPLTRGHAGDGEEGERGLAEHGWLRERGVCRGVCGCGWVGGWVGADGRRREKPIMGGWLYMSR